MSELQLFYFKSWSVRATSGEHQKKKQTKSPSSTNSSFGLASKFQVKASNDDDDEDQDVELDIKLKHAVAKPHSPLSVSTFLSNLRIL